jgi:hypothetical protein
MTKSTDAYRRRPQSHVRRPAVEIDFIAINRAALAQALNICRWLLPGGRVEGREYVALNPKRADTSLGSFKINLTTGRWCDFAVSEDRGGDLVSLTAWVFGVGQSEAALRLALKIGLKPEVRR